ncbi:SMC-Scp complex subunit ScpB [Micromonospora sp. CPCC 205546]|uniref:SMC-Scp complex subunit ScpB n=1 Tax=Micromonospora sp. CPCC 205546 TaxID=3122397 RepID=UPI002FF35A2B
MSSEERRDSLADQAAAWVPPWQRPTAPVAAPETADLGTSTPPEGPEPTKISGDVAGAAGETGGGEGKGGRGVPAKGATGRRRAAPAPEPAPELDDVELRGALEAILLVVDEPVSELTLAQVLEQPAERIGPVLDDIAAGYTAAGHGFELRRAAGGWRLYTRPEYATYVERFVLDGQSVRLTQAALETLAVVAYKQPVTRSRISAIRGVNCDGVIRTLVSRGLVEECGAEPDSGAFLYRTTTMFLEKLGLNSVDDLPPLAPFLPDDVEELADATR